MKAFELTGLKVATIFIILLGVCLFIVSYLTGLSYGDPVSVCNDGLWKHVYNPTRLQVHQMCTSVTGTIVDATHGERKDGARKEADGDCHGWLKLDPGQDQYLNDGNNSDEDGNLVFEIVCLFPVTQKDAISACRNYHNKVKLPPVGSHVRISGSWVQDNNHAKWNEIHPVSDIEVLAKP